MTTTTADTTADTTAADGRSSKNETSPPLYFHGDGPFHQGMFMATPEQLLSWQTRPPNCHFNDTWALENANRREKVSSLHLFDNSGCNVTQVIPIYGYERFLVHHMPNTQHKILYKHLDAQHQKALTSITSSELETWLTRSTTTTTTTSTTPHYKNTVVVRMFNDETHKNDSHPDLSEYERYYRYHHHGHG